MDIGFVLYAEHTDLRIVVTVDFLRVLWIDPLDGDVDV